MIVTITAADYLAVIGCTCTLTLANQGDVDLQDIIFKYNAASPLRDIEGFKAFKLDEWSTVVWDCGFDVSPETLYERATGKRIDWLQA